MNNLLTRCSKEGGGGYGQNIAAGVPADQVSKIITDMFYNAEVGYYDGLYGDENPDMSNFEKWGHFSQMVWKGTTHVGCATQHCNNLVNAEGMHDFTVCNYASPGKPYLLHPHWKPTDCALGNVAGAYGSNIGQPMGEPSADQYTGMDM